MSRRVYASALLLLSFVWMCCGNGVVHAEESNTGNVQLPEEVYVFRLRRTKVIPKDGTGSEGVRILFASPSLVCAGEAMAVLAEGGMYRSSSDPGTSQVFYSDLVAGYINTAGGWPSVVGQVSSDAWRAYTVIPAVNETDVVSVAHKPTTLRKGNKVFLLLGNSERKFEKGKSFWTQGGSYVQLVVGEPTPGSEGKLIKWGQPTSPLKRIIRNTDESGTYDYLPSGGSGVLMEDGTLVFSLEATRQLSGITSLILYSIDDGKIWTLSEGTLPAGCIDSLITEWERGQLLMVTVCNDDQKVYESRDMGKTWKEARGTLSGAWVRSQSGVREENLRMESIITATIGRTKVMLYAQRRYSPGETKRAKTLYLWVTDSNRTFSLGPLSVDDPQDNTIANAMLYSHDALYLSQERDTGMFLVSVTQQLERVKSVLKTWEQLDASLSKSSVPTNGLIGFLSNAASDDTWVDGYLCVNATVTSAKKVENGFEFTGPGSRAMWPVNSRENNNQYGFLSYGFALVATVVVHQVPSDSTPLMGAILGDGKGTTVVGLSYNAESKWETVFNGTKTTQSSTTWEPGKEYQVALMLQGSSKCIVYIDGQLVGSSEVVPTLEARGYEITDFYIGGDGAKKDSGVHVTVTNVFLYNRALSLSELKKENKVDISLRGGVSGLLLPLLLGLWGFAAFYGV